jgi:uncharacterized protein YukJ
MLWKIAESEIAYLEHTFPKLLSYFSIHYYEIILSDNNETKHKIAWALVGRDTNKEILYERLPCPLKHCSSRCAEEVMRLGQQQITVSMDLLLRYFDTLK